MTAISSQERRQTPAEKALSDAEYSQPTPSDIDRAFKVVLAQSKEAEVKTAKGALIKLSENDGVRELQYQREVSFPAVLSSSNPLTNADRKAYLVAKSEEAERAHARSGNYFGFASSYSLPILHATQQALLNGDSLQNQNSGDRRLRGLVELEVSRAQARVF